MAEYIDRTTLCRKINTGMNIIEAMQAIIDAPTADVVARDCYDRLLMENDRLRKERPVVRGKWKPFDVSYGRSVYYCTACECSTVVPTVLEKPSFNFCPNCGADMREEG